MKEVLQAGQKRILVVEDTSSWGEIFGEMFKGLGAEVVEVSCLEEAREILRDGQFTHIVCDGLEGAWEELLPQAGEAKFRLVSGSGAVERRAKELEVDFVRKHNIGIGDYPIEHLINS